MNSLSDDVHGADDETVVSRDGYVYRFPPSAPEGDRLIGIGRQATTIGGVIRTGEGCSDDAVRALLDLTIDGCSDE